MDMYNVLDTLKKIENPTEDQKAAIKSAEMTQSPDAPQGAVATTSTGDGIYQQYAPTGDQPTELARLAGIQTLNVQADTPETATESVEVKEAQSPAQKAAFQKMLDAKKGKTEDKEEETIEEAKPDFLDIDKDGDKEEPMKKAAKDKEEMKEEDTTPEQYEKNEKVEEDVEEIELDEAYDPLHVAGIVKKHEKEGHKVQMDRPGDQEQGFTVTFKDGKKRHYKYTKAGAKVTSLEPEDPLVDPDAPKRERGRPKKEGLGEEEAQANVLDTAFITMENEEKDDLTAMFEEKLNESIETETEEVAESLQVVQSIDDDDQETVSVNAVGKHTDMLKQLLNLSGQRSDGYDEYQGQEQEVPVEEERAIQHANTPNEQVTDVDTQLNTMSGGLNGPKDKSAAKSNSNPLYNESITDEKMMELYKSYKG